MLQISFITLFRISLKISSFCSLLFLNFLHYAFIMLTFIFLLFYAPSIFLPVKLNFGCFKFLENVLLE